jgi:uncharacterized protein (TIGR02145 family)
MRRKYSLFTVLFFALLIFYGCSKENNQAGGDSTPTAAALTSLICGSATNTGNLIIETVASGVSSVISYTGGNGGSYVAQTINSTGVTGLTAKLPAGTLANGSGSITYTITGTPATSGTAFFDISLGGQNCKLSRAVSNSSVPNATAHSCGAGATNVHNNTLSYGTMSDQDGFQYKTIKIGDQIWMAENLRTTKYRNNTPITKITDNTQWQNNTSGAYCGYTNALANECPYGKLYNWYAVNNEAQLCPTDWHVPTKAEWDTLITFLGGGTIAGSQAKSSGFSYWRDPNTGAANTSGFSGLPAGQVVFNGTYNSLGIKGYWWSSTKHDTDNASAFFQVLNYSEASFPTFFHYKSHGFSVRCVMD